MSSDTPQPADHWAVIKPVKVDSEATMPSEGPYQVLIGVMSVQPKFYVRD